MGHYSSEIFPERRDAALKLQNQWKKCQDFQARLRRRKIALFTIDELMLITERVTPDTVGLDGKLRRLQKIERRFTHGHSED